MLLEEGGRTVVKRDGIKTRALKAIYRSQTPGLTSGMFCTPTLVSVFGIRNRQKNGRRVVVFVGVIRDVEKLPAWYIYNTLLTDNTISYNAATCLHSL